MSTRIPARACRRKATVATPFRRVARPTMMMTAETAARYERWDLAGGSKADGLTTEELRAVIEAFGVRTTLLEGEDVAAGT
jgi:hypothetical protein